MPPEYTIVITDKAFKLSRSQIEVDSPNFFTSYFIHPTGQYVPQELELSRDPYLFTIILRYLNGYKILPLHPALVPPHCTLETALSDLLADARFYQLDGLSNLLSSRGKQGEAPNIRYAEITGQYNTKSNEVEPTDDFSTVVADFSLKLSSEQQYQTTTQQENFRPTPPSISGARADRFYLCFFNERIVREVLQRDGHMIGVNHWEQLGYVREMPGTLLRRSTIIVKLWTGPELKMN